MAERVAVLLASLALLAGCAGPVTGTASPVELTDADRTKLQASTTTRLNKAGDESPAEQQKLLKDTQHPDFRQKTCDLRGATIKVEPTWSTLADGRRLGTSRREGASTRATSTSSRSR